MELRHLRYFVAVADELHFGRAAGRIHTSQPSLSQQIRNLEKELRVDLLRRSRHHVALTRAGKQFLTEAREILAAAERAARLARQAASDENNTLALGISPETDWDFLRRVLRRFSRARPKVEIVFRNLPTGAQIDAIRTGDIDIGFVCLPLEDRLVTSEITGRVRLMIALPEGHRNARQPTVDLRDLAGERYALWPRHLAPGLYDQIERSFQQAGFGRPVRLEGGLPTTHTLIGMVSAGLLVAMVQPTAKELTHPGVVFRPSRAPAFVDLGVIYRSENLPGLVERFVKAVRSIVSGSADPPGRRPAPRAVS